MNLLEMYWESGTLEIFLIFNLIFISYWSTVDLQCCIPSVQQSESVKNMHIFILFYIVFLSRLL